jgi:hypothetical protein
MSQVHSLTTAVVISYMLLPAPFVTAAWLGGLAIYYGTTTFNKPEHTGEYRTDHTSACQSVMAYSSTSVVACSNPLVAVRSLTGRVWQSACRLPPVQRIQTLDHSQH